MAPQLTCWLSCGCRCLAVIFFVYVVMQLRLLLPNIAREIFGTLIFGLFCFVAVSMDFIPLYWYCFIAALAVGYLCAHWQFFSTRGKLQMAFPERNPSSHAVNQAVDMLMTHRRLYATVPLAFVAIHVGRLLWLGSMDGAR